MQEQADDTQHDDDATQAQTTETAETDPAETTEHTQPADDRTAEAEEDTFPRSYVEELRHENARYRQRAQRADDLARRLHTELVRATGKLADPSDMPFDETHLDDPAALDAAIENLVSSKPHLASRRPIGEIGQGATSSATKIDLAAILRQRAG